MQLNKERQSDDFHQKSDCLFFIYSFKNEINFNNPLQGLNILVFFIYLRREIEELKVIELKV